MLERKRCIHVANLVVLSLAVTAHAQVPICERRGTAANDAFATSLSPAGPYLVVGAPNATRPLFPPKTGTVTRFTWSRANGCTGVQTFSGNASNARFGQTLTHLGGQNVLIGSPSASTSAGAFSGQAWTLDVGTGAATRIDGVAANDRAGTALASGDFDGDGKRDYVLGAERNKHSCTSPCRYTCYGARVLVRSGDPSASRPWTWVTVDHGPGGCDNMYLQCRCRVGLRLGAVLALDVNGDGRDELLVGDTGSHDSSRLGQNLVWVYEFDKTGNRLKLLRKDIWSRGKAGAGTSLVGLGDLNGDKVPDYAAGAPDGASRGRVFFVDGKTGTALLVVDVGVAGFGRSLANIGDQDGVPGAELLVGGPGTDNGAGAAWVLSYDHASRRGDLLYYMRSGVPGAAFGYSATALEDLTGDGKPEFAIGAPAAYQGAGFVRIYSLDDKLADHERVGVGCAPRGTQAEPPTIVTPNGMPELGKQDFAWAVARAPVGQVAVFVWGFRSLPNPLDLGVIDPTMSGCRLHVLPEYPGTAATKAFHAGGAGWAEYGLPIPNLTELRGVTLHAQWLVRSGSLQVFPMVVTPGLRLTIQP